MKARKLLDKRIREALKKDFNELYQRGYASNYKSLETIRNTEINIMSIDNIRKLIEEERRGGGKGA